MDVNYDTESNSISSNTKKSNNKSYRDEPSRESLKNIHIQNFYHMLSYCDGILNQDYKEEEGNFDFVKFQSILDVMGDILVKYLRKQIARGLGKEYQLMEDDLSTPRGKIHITQSIRPNNLLRKRLHCSYDEMTVNTKMNQIVKSTVCLLLTANISDVIRIKIKSVLNYFNEVDSIDLRFVDWNITYNRNNGSYKAIINLCHMIVDGWTQAESEGKLDNVQDYIFTPNRYAEIFELFLRNYYRFHYGNQFDVISDEKLTWSAVCSDKDKNYLSPMITDIYLKRGNKVLIIDAKFYTDTLNGARHIDSDNLYQIFSYVKNCEHRLNSGGHDTNHEVTGMLLYAKPYNKSNASKRKLELDCHYNMCGSDIIVKTLDMDRPFDKYAQELDGIVASYFGNDLIKRKSEGLLT